MTDQTMTDAPPVVEVVDQGQRISFSFADLLAYHGPGFPGGVAHGFTALRRALPLLSPDGPPERRDISVRTAFRGPGGRDAFELVTRAWTGERYTIDHSLERAERGETLARYVFEVSYRDRVVTLQIREGFVRDEFIALSRREDRTEADERHLAVLKQEMADRLLSRPPAEVYDVHEAG